MRQSKAVLLIIIAGTFIVRLIGINYGLPFTYHDDEPIIVNYALAYGAGDFNPHVFKMSPLVSYILFFIYGLLFVTGFMLRFFKTINDFAYLYLNNPTIFYIIGRFIFGVLCGSASVALIYSVAKRYFNNRTALFAALFLALNFLHVRDSHYLYFDIPLTLSVLAFFLKADDLFRPETKMRDYIYLGALFGLACSIKYSGALLIAPFLAVILYNLYISKTKDAASKIKDISAAFASFAAIIFILNPFSLIDFQTFKRDISSLPFIPLSAHFHLKISLINGCGLLMTAAGILGMLISLLFKRNRQALLILYVIFYYWVISRSSQDAERLVLPIIPILLMFSASVIAEIKNSIIAVLLSTLFIWPSAEGIYYSDSLFLKKDTRTLAYEWIKQNLKKDSKIALDASASGFPRLERSKEQIKELINYPLRPQFARPDRSQEIKLNFMLNNPSYPEKGYYLFYLKEDTHRGFLSSQPGIDIDYKSLKQYKIEYIVLSNLLLDRRYEKFAEDIEDRGTLVKTFSPYREGAKRVMPNERSTIPCAAFMLDELKARQRYGPVIRIYKII